MDLKNDPLDHFMMDNHTGLLSGISRKMKYGMTIARFAIMMMVAVSWIVSLLRILVGNGPADQLTPQEFSIWPVCYYENDLGFLQQFLLWITVRAVSAPYLYGNLRDIWSVQVDSSSPIDLRRYYGITVSNLFQFVFFLAINVMLLNSGQQMVASCTQAIVLETLFVLLWVGIALLPLSRTFRLGTTRLREQASSMTHNDRLFEIN